jgi:hypothetical protein
MSKVVSRQAIQIQSEFAFPVDQVGGNPHCQNLGQKEVMTAAPDGLQEMASILPGHSRTKGQPTLRDGTAVEPDSANSSTWAPETTPHQSVILACSREDRLTTKSPVAEMILWECLSGRIWGIWAYGDGKSIGGPLHTLLLQAMVTRLGRYSPLPPELTNNSGTVARTLPGFQDCFSMGIFAVVAVSGDRFDIED